MNPNTPTIPPSFWETTPDDIPPKAVAQAIINAELTPLGFADLALHAEPSTALALSALNRVVQGFMREHPPCQELKDLAAMAIVNGYLNQEQAA